MRAALRWLLWFLGLTALMGVVVGCAAALTWVSGSLLLGGFAALLFGTAALVAGSLKIPGGGEGAMLWGLGAGVLVAFVGFLGGVPLTRLARVASGDEVADVALDAIAGHPEATRIGLRDARLATEATYTRWHRHPGRNARSHEHAVAPIVSSTWRPGEPLRVYAACHEIDGDPDGCHAAWRTPTAAVVRADPDELECYRGTLPTAALPPDGAVEFVYWQAPAVYMAERRDEWRIFVGVVGTAWLAFGLIGVIVTGVHALRR